MKPSPNEQRILQRMAPGALCKEGFLGSDARPLWEIVDTDRSTVEGLGTSHERIAEKLAEVLRAAVAAIGRPVEIAEGLTATWYEAMGKIPSPYADGVFPKGEVMLTDTRSGERLVFTPLSVHLIGRHGFYEGRGSRYRIEPETACRMLDLAS